MPHRSDHPVIDSDGHVVEFMPALLESLAAVAGPAVAKRYQDFFEHGFLAWYSKTKNQRAHQRMTRGPWWALPAENTLDRATASLPRLLYHRLDEIGIDYAVMYPSTTLIAPELSDEELRRSVCRAVNVLHAEIFREYRDRLTPAAVIPMHSPEEAIDELDVAVGELGHKVIMMAGVVRRPVPAAAELSIEAASYGGWIDSLAVDSEHDYDPVWKRCVELGVSPTFHSTLQGFGTRASISNYVFNHLGAFAAAGEATARALFLGGVTRRFPSLRFAFLEGGVGWACNLYSDLVGHWEKRGGDRVRAYDPSAIDGELLVDLFERYSEPSYRDKLNQITGSVGLHVTPEDESALDEFSACRIERAEDIRTLFADPFVFGCEADDPINAWAFNEKLNPFGARMAAIFSSDIGHWDVPDVTRVTDEAWAMVEHGFISERDYRDFTFATPGRFWTANRPDFFHGTAVESAVATLLSESPESET
ncbi:amidohydrolase family protein [Myxococcota bacterium]|nr:amidohydrolase family protein [Myxococcota bacterium]